MTAFDATLTTTAFNAILLSVLLPQIIDVYATMELSNRTSNAFYVTPIARHAKVALRNAPAASKGNLLQI